MGSGRGIESEFEQSGFSFSSSTGAKMEELIFALWRFVGFFVRLAFVPLTIVISIVLGVLGILKSVVGSIFGIIGALVFPLLQGDILGFIINIVLLPIYVAVGLTVALVLLALTSPLIPLGILMQLEQAFLVAMSGGDDRVKDLETALYNYESKMKDDKVLAVSGMLLLLFITPVRFALTVGLVLPLSIALGGVSVVMAIPISIFSAFRETCRNTMNPLDFILFLPRFILIDLPLAILWAVPTAFVLCLLNGAMIYQSKRVLPRATTPYLTTNSAAPVRPVFEGHLLYDMLLGESRLMRVVRSVQYLADVVPRRDIAVKVGYQPSVPFLRAETALARHNGGGVVNIGKFSTIAIAMGMGGMHGTFDEDAYKSRWKAEQAAVNQKVDAYSRHKQASRKTKSPLRKAGLYAAGLRHPRHDYSKKPVPVLIKIR
ncbi:MAG TPA: hypothetical protein VNC84_00980 [Gammaproteobacteria bacterium]|jgi:hypothetical protein|nr:hypothetical protein [Gammaproteobacteria bacterium]